MVTIPYREPAIWALCLLGVVLFLALARIVWPIDRRLAGLPLVASAIIATQPFWMWVADEYIFRPK